MTDREAMQMALDALETVTTKMLECRDELAEYGGRPKTISKQLLWDSSYDVYVDNAIPAAEALRTALAQGEQENMNEPRNGWQLREVWFEDGEPLMHREPSKPEPVAWMHTTATGEVYFRKKPQDKVFNPQPVYTAPPKREWQGLTDEEMRLIRSAFNDSLDTNAYCRAIEAALEEKNT